MQILENVFNPSTLNIMLDIETTGTRPGCRVLSIGLAYFDESGVKENAYILPSIEQQIGVDEQDTLKWWGTQSADARCVFADNVTNGVSVEEAAEEMKEFISQCIGKHMSRFTGEGEPSVHIWGNGATFDNAILAKMFYDNGIQDIPWNTFGDRCYRTLIKTLNTAVPKVPRGTAHNSVEDAIYQVNVLIETLRNAG